MTEESTRIPLTDLAGNPIEGREHLACAMCGHDRFSSRKALLNTPGATFFKLDWANHQAKCHCCARCGYIHWFLF